jgi:hypothetical protein
MVNEATTRSFMLPITWRFCELVLVFPEGERGEQFGLWPARQASAENFDKPAPRHPILNNKG